MKLTTNQWGLSIPMSINAAEDEMNSSKKQSNLLKMLVEQVQSDDWRDRFKATLQLETLVSDAGEIAVSLQQVALKDKSPGNHIAIWLVSQIGKQTTSRWKRNASNLLCPDCMIFCSRHKIRLPKSSVTFYGCRHCHQSREFLDVTNKTILAILDNQMKAKYMEENDTFRVNWLVHRGLIDFDEVEFIQATDEDAERFAVQLGNNTDRTRHPNYQKVRCKVSSSCRFSTNTIRILQKIFGQVTISTNNKPNHFLYT